MKIRHRFVKILLGILLFGLTVPLICPAISVSAEQDGVVPTDSQDSDGVPAADLSNGINSQKRDNIILNAYLVPLQTEELRRAMFEYCREEEIDVLSHVYVEEHWEATDHDYAHYALIMEEAAEYGLKVLTRDYRAQTADERSDAELIELAREYKDLPGFAGFYIIDEPFYPNTYARAENVLRSVTPGALVNVNFLPNRCYSAGIYYRHLVDYGAITAADGTLSMDCYCFGPNGGVNESSLFSNYNDVRLAGLRTSQNTAVYVQSVGYPGNYRTPSEGDLRYNMMAALAYGVKEIKFFTWGTSNSGLYEDAVIGMDYQPTARHEYLCRINKKVHALGTYLAASDALRVYHTRITTSGCYEKLPDDAFIHFENGRTNLIVSLLQEREGDDEYFMLVNKELEKSQTFSFTLDGIEGLQVVDDTTGELKPVSPTDGKYAYTLQAGDSILFKLPAGDFVQKETVDTDNLAVNAVWKATSSTSDCDYYIADLFDGKTETGARLTSGANGESDQSVTLDFGKVTCFNRIDLSPLGKGEKCGLNFPKTVTVSVSDDGYTFRTVARETEQSLFPDRSTVPELRLADTEARYVRLTFGGFAHDGQYCELSEIAVYNETADNKDRLPKNAATAYTQPKITDDTDLAASASLFDASSGLGSAANVIGHAKNTWKSDGVHEYRGAEEWVTVDLGDVFSVNSVTIGAAGKSSFPEDFEILLSADGVHFTSVARREGVTADRDTTLDFDPVPARYVKVLVTRLPACGYVELSRVSVKGAFFDGATEFPVDTEPEDVTVIEPDTAENDDTELITDAAEPATDGDTAVDETAADTVPEPQSEEPGTVTDTAADTAPQTDGGCGSIIAASSLILITAGAGLLLSRNSGKAKKSLLCLTVLCSLLSATLILSSCRSGEGTDTSAQSEQLSDADSQPATQDGTAPVDDATQPDESETAVQGTDEPATDEPATQDERTEKPDDGYIREPEQNKTYTLSQGKALNLVFSRDGNVRDTVGNALTYVRGGRVLSREVTYNGKSYVAAGYLTAGDGSCIGLDMTAFTEDFLRSLADGYSIEVGIMFNDGQPVGNANRAVFSGTEYGLFGLFIEKGRFKLVHYADKPVELTSDATVEPGVLYHVIATYDAGAGKIALYINGEKAAEAAAGTLTVGKADGFFCLGADADGDKDFGSYANYGAFYTAAAIYGEPLSGSDLSAAGEAFESTLAGPPAKLEPLYNPSAYFSLYNLELKGDISKDSVLTLSGAVINDSDSERIVRLKLDYPADKLACDTALTELTVPADGVARFAILMTVATEHPGRLPMTLSILTGEGQTVVSEPVIGMERFISLEKTKFDVGEDIIVTASGGAADWIGFYIKEYVPGQDATVYLAHFDGWSDPSSVIPVNTPVSIKKDFTFGNPGNPQAEPYKDLPAGEYKIILFAGGYSIAQQIDIRIGEEPPEQKPWEGIDVSDKGDRYLFSEKTTYKKGEKIYIQASGKEGDWVIFYPIDFVPGQDASIYWGNFKPVPANEEITAGEVIAVQDLPGNNWGNWQADKYRGLPAGKYKILLMAPGRVEKARIEIDIVN